MIESEAADARDSCGLEPTNPHVQELVAAAIGDDPDWLELASLDRLELAATAYVGPAGMELAAPGRLNIAGAIGVAPDRVKAAAVQAAQPPLGKAARLRGRRPSAPKAVATEEGPQAPERPPGALPHEAAREASTGRAVGVVAATAAAAAALGAAAKSEGAAGTRRGPNLWTKNERQNPGG
ncbi:uncharacterized protein LOC126249486 [Schistocerca nitens]|uniref:uncharacterized protein LOC126249486 n=1 Tax=Schistocerca nitens TaxID=7011 RepID=UPI002119829F|nr:uncharacterized protein LOC126249486 [Schistocerca nitens]